MKLMDVTVGLPSTIYQMFWESGEVPADWKLASIKHIYKKERRCRKRQTCYSNISPWESYGEDCPGGYWKIFKEQSYHQV